MTTPRRNRRSEGGGTAARILVIFFLIGVVVLFLLARGCYKLAKNAVDSAATSAKPSTKTTPEADRFVFPEQKCPDFAAAQAAEQRSAQANARIPLIHDLTIDSVLSLKSKDIEGIRQFSSDDDRSITYSFSGSGFHRANGEVVVDKSFQTAPTTVCRAEIPTSHVYLARMYDQHPAVFSEGTYQQISTAAFRELKDNRSTRIHLRTNAVMKSGSLAFEGDQFIILRRTDNGSATFHVLVNGVPTDLPVITADGSPDSGSGVLKFAALDDPTFPLILNWDWVGNSDVNKVIKINYPVQKQIERELADQGRAEIYGIYFDFDSADIRSESEPVLAEIAEALRKNPEWKLSVEGHTDNVGGDRHNMELSQRRAASVIDALASRHQISADRLSAAGFGASKPKATNDTIDGRALNRRVELVRK